MTEKEKLIKINIENEMKTFYIDYSMSVIVSRALPDVRDGLKPVHRRVLFGMYELGMLSNKPYKKSARVVGEVLAKYHPHGDNSVYDAMVRMAQKWSLRYLLIDGQGNFGSIDGDPPAAMRYTETRLQKLSEEMLSDIEKETVDIQSNFDDSLTEPSVLPSKIPNLLINGSYGIAVGMATNMAPHNLKECIDAICAYIQDPKIEIKDLIKYIKAPDFPTGGIIYGYNGVKEAFYTGRGKIILRSKVKFEKINNKECIIIKEIPYQINKSDLITKIVDLIKIGKINEISNVRDESDRNGMRIVICLKYDTISNVVLNKLFKYTQLETSFNVNNIALVNGKPMQLNLKDLIYYFVNHRYEIVKRRTKYKLKKAEEYSNILEGIIIALENLDNVIDLIKKSNTPDEARKDLIEKFKLGETQAKSILDMRLNKLTELENGKIKIEYNKISKSIEKYKNILNSKLLIMSIIKNELLEIKNKFKDKRRTSIDYSGKESTIEDLISNEKVVLTISHAGYIKRTPLNEYKCQLRGGIGNRAAKTREEDFLEYLLIAKNHDNMIFFTKEGKCFWLRVYEIPIGSKISKGRAIQNLIMINDSDKIKAFVLSENFKDNNYINNHNIIMVTEKGVIKKTSLEKYSRPRKNGIKAINIRKGDTLLEAKLTNGNNDILIALKSGKAIRFHEDKVRIMGRNSYGVIGISLSNKDDKVVGMVCVEKNNKEDILVVSEKGYGKRSYLNNYRTTNRGGKGIKTINITKKTGHLVSIKNVSNENDLMIINKSGVAIRIPVSNIRVIGRATQGVKLINIRDRDEIASVAKIINNEEDIKKIML